MSEYRPLKDLEIFISDSNGDFIVAKHTSSNNVKVSFGYSDTFVNVSNYQAYNHDDEKRTPEYINRLQTKYAQLRDEKHNDDIDWAAIHQETIDRLENLKSAKWARLGREVKWNISAQ